ncbi:hypothetical protein Loa_02422 [Legionella oakridgensis ATCC 33761 = DSM 21215]|uniref:Uncharacterized protein n=2 Tax=Legionella oakridgensis TaxID=29423 RepID=W0BHS7_9GAMM|nr:hypothetical protein Loa_02422 [Legionella oakridgensis ATCC 33761 = DSM 21215]ETO92595.1 hypothetical protein LOR_63c16810 [Legionella oakridgensis RV-2-2007]KTD38780.1 hypothetical protein Loak_1268 [Legionella oakridgensis]STY20964.1 Uncharacterised protein [Legionella longbeachae]
MALDPQFAKTHHLYLYVTTRSNDSLQNQIIRYTYVVASLPPTTLGFCALTHNRLINRTKRIMLAVNYLPLRFNGQQSITSYCTGPEVDIDFNKQKSLTTQDMSGIDRVANGCTHLRAMVTCGR